MASLKLFGAALILSTAFATPVFAQIPLPGIPSSCLADSAWFVLSSDRRFQPGRSRRSGRSACTGCYAGGSRLHRAHHIRAPEPSL